VGDAELTAFIRGVPAFQSNGQFDRTRYEQMLAQLGMTPEAFETAQRDDLLIQKVSDMIARTAKVAEDEAAEWYRWENAAVNVEYVLFAPDQTTVAVPSDNEIRTYFESQQDRYKTPAKRSARYLVYRTADYRPQVRLTDEDVRAYYEDHIDEFAIAESVEARHILFKLDQDADQSTVDAVRARADEVHAQITAGGDFAELAKTYSEETTTGSKGGYLGTFERGQMVKPFEETAFALESGQVSQPVRTPFGYHIIKVDQKTAAGTRTLAEADSKIRGLLTDRRAQALALEDAEAAYDLSYENEDLAVVAQQVAQTLQTTGMIARNQAVDGVTDPTAFGRVLFGLSADGISDVQEIDGDYYIIQVQAVEEPRVPDLEAVKASVMADWKQAQSWERAEEQAGAFLQALVDGGRMDALSADQGLTLETTGFFKRNEAIEKIGYQPEMAAAAFTLSEQNPLPENPVRSGDGFYVFRLLDRQAPTEAITATDLEQIKTQLQQRKQRQLFEDWVAEARSRADIQIDRTLLK
jgi:peptidyl-prolyl cis-trans isomerase D